MNINTSLLKQPASSVAISIIFLEDGLKHEYKNEDGKKILEAYVWAVMRKSNEIETLTIEDIFLSASDCENRKNNFAVGRLMRGFLADYFIKRSVSVAIDTCETVAVTDQHAWQLGQSLMKLSSDRDIGSTFSVKSS